MNVTKSLCFFRTVVWISVSDYAGHTTSTFGDFHFATSWTENDRFPKLQLSSKTKLLMQSFRHKNYITNILYCVQNVKRHSHSHIGFRIHIPISISTLGWVTLSQYLNSLVFSICCVNKCFQ